MATVAARLTKTGTLYTNSQVGVVLDEISQANISITPTKVYAGTLDEVTGTENGRAMQQLNTGVLRVAEVFDEVTGTT
jgi:hypothetical protein